jgi:hypothetical protein
MHGPTCIFWANLRPLSLKGGHIVAVDVTPEMAAAYPGMRTGCVLRAVASQPVNGLPLVEVHRLMENVSEWAHYVVDFRSAGPSPPRGCLRGR